MIGFWWISDDSPWCSGEQVRGIRRQFWIIEIPLRDDNYKNTLELDFLIIWPSFSMWNLYFHFRIGPNTTRIRRYKMGSTNIQVIEGRVYLLCGKQSIKSCTATQIDKLPGMAHKAERQTKGRRRWQQRRKSVLTYFSLTLRLFLSAQDVCFLKSICTHTSGVAILCPIQIINFQAK